MRCCHSDQRACSQRAGRDVFPDSYPARFFQHPAVPKDFLREFSLDAGIICHNITPFLSRVAEGLALRCHGNRPGFQEIESSGDQVPNPACAVAEKRLPGKDERESALVAFFRRIAR
jgi:hypothetical protein